MDEVVKDAQNAFRSARLSYVRIDPSNEDYREFAPQTVNDPTVFVLSGPHLLRPTSKKNVDGFLEATAKSFLHVAMCIIPDDEQPSNSSPDPQPDKKEDTTKSKPKPTIIGNLIVDSDMNHHRTASIGLSIAQPYQNKGYGREAINWALDWAFTKANIHTVEIGTASYNERAAHLYEDMGFVPEKRRREVIWLNRKWYDELSFSMTEGDWEALRGFNKDA